jgi:hypothetical protein
MRTLLVAAAVLFTMSARAADWSKRIEITGKPELRIASDDADVILKAGSPGAVEARLTTKGWTIGRDGVRVEVHQNANRVEIEVRVPASHWGLGNRSVRLEVSVPPELSADVHTGDGDISATALKGEFRFTSGDGAIEAESLDGTLTARSGDGRLGVRGRFDQLDLHTNDGSITAALSPGSKMAGPWRMETGDGGITLRLPEGFAADIDARTGDGDISCSLPKANVSHSGPTSFRGKVNGGGMTLRIHTGDGSIRIDQR